MARRLGVSALVWLALARGGAAQQVERLPTPDEAAEPTRPAEPLGETSLAEPQQGPRAPRWRTALRLSAGYDSNVGLASAEQAAGDYPGELLASLAGKFERKGWRLGLQLDGGGTLYAQSPEYRAPILGGGLSLEGPLSSRTQLLVRQDYRRDYARSILRFADAGLVPGKVITSSYTGRAGVAQELTPRLSLVADASYEQVRYDDDARPAGDTRGLSAGFAWARRETERVELRYAYRNTESGPEVGQGHHGELSWSRRLSAKLDAGLSAGIGRDRPLGSPQSLTPWLVTGRLAGRHGRHVLDANYRHALDQAYGFGRSLLFDTGSLGETYSLTRRLSAVLRGSLSRGRDPLDDSYRLDGESLQAELALRVSPRASSGAAFSYVRTRETGQPDVSSLVIDIWLAHERPWR